MPSWCAGLLRNSIARNLSIRLFSKRDVFAIEFFEAGILLQDSFSKNLKIHRSAAISTLNFLGNGLVLRTHTRMYAFVHLDS